VALVKDIDDETISRLSHVVAYFLTPFK